jgi:hypothetical protein
MILAPKQALIALLAHERPDAQPALGKPDGNIVAFRSAKGRPWDSDACLLSPSFRGAKGDYSSRPFAERV